MNHTKKISIAAGLGLAVIFAGAAPVLASRPIDGFEAHPPIHIKGPAGHGGSITNTVPSGLSPAAVKAAYNLPQSGGQGTIAIVDAYTDPNVEKDLATFSTQFGLPPCTTANGCLTVHAMAPRIKSNSGWALEESLDTQWAHAIAPSAKILLVIAKSSSGNDLLNAVDYARSQTGVVSVSMSWGGSEFSGESTYDTHFTGPAFFASSGDAGSGVEWPAVSGNVIGVGGTTLSLAGGTVSSETAWSGSGGGLSAYEQEPAYQSAYVVPQANNMRAVPDVSYDADPNTGFSVYDSLGYQGIKGWFVVGGTSAGAPQWAAIEALGSAVSSTSLYTDAASPTAYAADLRDITSGTNGSCGFYCTAQTAYDYVTGLGSPLTVSF